MRDRIKFFSVYDLSIGFYIDKLKEKLDLFNSNIEYNDINDILELMNIKCFVENNICLLYTSPSPRDKRQSRMPSSA